MAKHGLQRGNRVASTYLRRREAFAKILHRPGAGKLLLDFVQLALIHAAEPRALDAGMPIQAVALQLADAAHTDLEDAQLAVLVHVRPRGQAERCEPRGENGTGLEEASPRNGRTEEVFGFEFMGKKQASCARKRSTQTNTPRIPAGDSRDWIAQERDSEAAPASQNFFGGAIRVSSRISLRIAPSHS